MQPIVDRMLASLERVRLLAAGVAQRGDPPPKTVPRANMEDALMLAEGVAERITEWHQRVEPLRSLGWGGVVSDLLYGVAESGANGVVRAISSRLARPRAAEIEPIALAVLISYDSRVVGARDLLLVLSGEVVWNDSPLSAISRSFAGDADAFAMHATDTLISFLPVVGPIYDISTGILGRRLPDYGRLTNTERVLRITLTGVGVLLGLVVKGVRVSTRTLLVMQAGLRSKLLVTSLSQVHAFRALFIAVGTISPKNAALLMQIVEKVRRGAALTSTETQLLHSFFHTVNQTATAAHWAVLSKEPAHIGGTVGKAAVFHHVVHEAGEKEAITALSRNLPEAEILSLPNMTPKDFLEIAKGTTGLNPLTGKPILRATQEAKMPDLFLQGALADIYAPKGSNMKAVLNTIAAKTSQGSTVVVCTDFTALTPQQILAKLPSVWGNPHAMSLRRVIVLNSAGHFTQVARPTNFRFAEIGEMPVQSLQNLRELWLELERNDASIPLAP